MKRGDIVYYMGIKCRVCDDTNEEDTMVKLTNAKEFGNPYYEEMYADYYPIKDIKFGN